MPARLCWQDKLGQPARDCSPLEGLQAARVPRSAGVPRSARLEVQLAEGQQRQQAEHDNKDAQHQHGVALRGGGREGRGVSVGQARERARR